MYVTADFSTIKHFLCPCSVGVFQAEMCTKYIVKYELITRLQQSLAHVVMMALIMHHCFVNHMICEFLLGLNHFEADDQTLHHKTDFMIQ